jgi:cytidylate kinase
MLNVAIDGPAGAGKSTVAKAVADKLGCIYLDTGAMYRATAYFALKNGVAVNDEKTVNALLDSLKMDIIFENGVQQIYVNGTNTTPFLREHFMSKAASDISALPSVRHKMVDLQRGFARQRDVVLDGRDIGTFVLPDASCKIFLTASAEKRAERRFKELCDSGKESDYQTILADIMQRDYNDSHRAVAPLKQADDAVLLDTTEMTVAEAIAAVINIVEKRKVK